MYSELVTEPYEYARPKFPNFGQPKIIGYMSLNGKRQYKCDTSQLKFARSFCHRTSVNFDLKKNYELAVHRVEENKDEKIVHLLQFLNDQQIRLNEHLRSTSVIEEAKIFCYRGVLTLIACTPYENQDSWRIVAALHKGNIYLCARPTPEKIERENNMSEKEKQCSSWGYKFEQYVLSDNPDSEPCSDQPVDENEEFSLVFTNKLNRHTLVYGAEMDGIRCDKNIAKPPENATPEDIIKYLAEKEFIELKTSRRIDNRRQDVTFRKFKAKKWWCQSFLAGVDTVLAGFRDDDGIVTDLKLFSVSDLAKMREKFWDPTVCFTFLDTFLTYVKRCLENEVKRKHSSKSLAELPVVSLHFEWAPRRTVRVTDNYDPLTDAILPEWFVNAFGKTDCIA